VSQLVRMSQTPSLRAVGANKIEGIIVPFRSVDKFGNWWDKDTDFDLTVLRSRPVFWAHRRKDAFWERAGVLLDESFDFFREGLFARAELFDNEVGSHFMQHVQANNAAWSTGTIPTWWRARPDGYVERWAFVEASGAPANLVVSQLGTTRISHVRSLMTEQNFEDQELKRSIFVMPGNGFVRQQEEQDQATDWQAAIGAFERVTQEIGELTQEIGELRSQVTELQERPQRQLPEPGEVGHQRAADISVYSKWDEASLFGLSMLHEIFHTTGRHHREMDESFMRALVHKTEQAYKWQLDEIEEKGELRSMPWIDGPAYGAVHKRVPYLRADEAMGSTLANLGDELVPTILSSVYWREVFLATKVVQQFPIVDMSSQPWNYPTVGAGPVVRLVSEITDQTNFTVSNSIIPASQVATDKIVFSAGKLGALVLGSEELFEDSINIDVLRLIVDKFRIAMAQSWDETVMSGDETASVANISHLGTDPTGTVYDKFLAVDGLRHMAIGAADSVAHTTISADSGLTLQKLMGARGRLGIDPRLLVMFVDPGVYYQLVALDAFESLADLGPQATLLTGMVGQIKGVPIVVTDQLENTNASGQIEDSHDSTKGSFLVCNKMGIIIGKRRDIKIDSMVAPGADGRAVWATMRFDVQQMEAGHVAYGYNTTV